MTTFRSEREPKPSPARAHAERVAHLANAAVAELDWRDEVNMRELRNRFRRVQFIPRFGAWYSPA